MYREGCRQVRFTFTSLGGKRSPTGMPSQNTTPTKGAHLNTQSLLDADTCSVHGKKNPGDVPVLSSDRYKFHMKIRFLPVTRSYTPNYLNML